MPDTIQFEPEVSIDFEPEGPTREEKKAAYKQQKAELEMAASQGRGLENLAGFGERLANTVAQMHPLAAIRPFVNPYRQVLIPPEVSQKVVESIGGPAAQGSALQGVQQFASELISGLSAPENVAAMVIAPSAPAAVGRLFQTEMAGAIPEQIQQLRQAQTTPEVVKAGLNLAATPAMMAGIEYGLSKPKAAPTDIREPAMGSELKLPKGAERPPGPEIQFTPETKGEPNAVPERSTEAIPVEVPPGRSETVGTRVSEPEKATEAQSAEGPSVVEGGKPEAQGEVLLNDRDYNAGFESGSKVGQSVFGTTEESGRILLSQNLEKANKAISDPATEPKVKAYWQGYLDAVSKEPEAKPSLIAQEKAPEVPAPSAATGELGNRTVEQPAVQPPAISETKPKGEILQVGVTPAVKKVKAQVEKVATTEGQRPAKEIKSELVSRIEQAIADAPNAADVPAHSKQARSYQEKITIEIPEDGTFTILNTKESLTALLQRAKSIDTRLTTSPKKIPTGGADNISEQADKVIAAYGSAEKAYQSAKRQRDALPDNDLETPVRAKSAEYLMRELYGRTKAGIAEAKAETARESAATYREGAKGFQEQIAKVETIKRPTRAHKERLEDLRSRYAENQRRIEEFDRTAEKLEQEAAKGKAALEAPEEPTIVGLGGATLGEKPAQAQIEQLSESFKGVHGEKEPLGTRLKESLLPSERTTAYKDLLSRAITSLKEGTDKVISKWRGDVKIDDLVRAKGSLSAELEKRGVRVRQWVKQARKAVPSRRMQAAISKWVDAGGDRAALEQGYNETKPEFKQAYLDALNLKGDMLVAAENIRSYFDSRLQEAIDAGVLKEGVEDYIHRVYSSRPEVEKKAIATLQTGILRANPALIKKRVFDFDWQAEKEGYKPIQSFVDRIAIYESSLSRAIAAREFIRKATTMKAADGRPVIDVKGVGVPIEDPLTGAREATLIKPSFNPAKSMDPGTDNYRGDYVNKEFPALSKWKWVASDTAGNPILVQGDVAIHPDYAPRITALLEPSRLRYGKYQRILRPALGISGTIKQTMLDLSGFHQVQITVHGLEHKVLPWKIVDKIDFENPNVDKLLNGGITLGGDYFPYSSEGLFGNALTRHIPWLGPLGETYHNWLFQSYIPRIKMTMALNALERNRVRDAGRLTDEQIAYKTAQQANSAFGELNYIMLERSKTARDLSRLILLAPDFLEARIRFALEALVRGGKSAIPGFGNEQRVALLLGALTMYITARIANKMVDDQYHFEPENLFSLVYKNHAYSMRTVQGDILHAIEQPLQFWLNRLNPGTTRPGLQLLTGRDYFGRQRTPLQTLADTAINMTPISLRHGKERKIWESLLNSFGVNARRYNAMDDAFKLAQDWKQKNGIGEPGEFIYDSTKDPLRGLKIALVSEDDAAAAKEIKAIFDSGKYNRKKLNDYFKRYGNMRFTGSTANDRKWMDSLNEDQKKTVEAAVEGKRTIRDRYFKALGLFDAMPVKP